MEVETTFLENVKIILIKFNELVIDEEWVSTPLVSFVSDGALNIPGQHSGVGQRPKAKFANLILWHYANHKMELAVGEAIKNA